MIYKRPSAMLIAYVTCRKFLFPLNEIYCLPRRKDASVARFFACNFREIMCISFPKGLSSVFSFVRAVSCVCCKIEQCAVAYSGDAATIAPPIVFSL